MTAPSISLLLIVLLWDHSMHFHSFILSLYLFNLIYKLSKLLYVFVYIIEKLNMLLIDVQSFDCMLGIPPCVDIRVWFFIYGTNKGKLEYQPRHRVPVVTVGWKSLIVVNEEGTISVSPQPGASPLRKGMADFNITFSDYLLSSPWHCNILFPSSI